MEKEQEQKPSNQKSSSKSTIDDSETENQTEAKSVPLGQDKKEDNSPEEKIKELEDKLARAFAEMENQRRRFEKEKDDAFEYGGF